MPVCPHCGKEIDHLISVWEVHYIEELKAYPTGRGDFDFEETPDSREPADEDFLGFKCPECGEFLFDSMDEAWRFLRG